MTIEEEIQKQEPLPNWQKKLSQKDYDDFLFTKQRIEQLKEVRQDVYGINLEEIWKDADDAYIPHKLKTKGRRVVATDEEKGWRGTLTTIGEDDWQSDASQPNPFIKIQTALSILIDRNPIANFLPGSKKYESTNL